MGRKVRYAVVAARLDFAGGLYAIDFLAKFFFASR
jgi:hypothetical protein